MGNLLRTKRNKRIGILCLGVLLAALSCKQPLPTHQLQVLPDHCLKTTDTLYFSAPLLEESARYRIALTARTDHRLEDPFWSLRIRATAPSGQSYEETIELPLDANTIDAYQHQCLKNRQEPAITVITTRSGNDLTWLYRTGIQPIETGLWEIAIYCNTQEPISGLHCLGLICTAEQNE